MTITVTVDESISTVENRGGQVEIFQTIAPFLKVGYKGLNEITINQEGLLYDITD